MTAVTGRVSWPTPNPLLRRRNLNTDVVSEGERFESVLPVTIVCTSGVLFLSEDFYPVVPPGSLLSVTPGIPSSSGMGEERLRLSSRVLRSVKVSSVSGRMPRRGRPSVVVYDPPLQTLVTGRRQGKGSRGPVSGPRHSSPETDHPSRRLSSSDRYWRGKSDLPLTRSWTGPRCQSRSVRWVPESPMLCTLQGREDRRSRYCRLTNF